MSLRKRATYKLNVLTARFLRKIAVIATVIFFYGICLSAKESNIDREIRNLENFSNVYHLIQQRYIKRQTSESLIKSALQGMVKGLDRYSTILSSKELEILELQSVGKYTGIGISIQERDKLFIVTQVFDNSPAYNAGLKPGDIIVRVNDSVLGNKSIEDLNQLVVGEIGTSINIGFYHVDQSDHIIRRTVTRALVKVNSVESFEYDQSIGVIRIHQFLKHTPREISEYLAKKSHKTIILDLRNNPGGLLVSAVETAEIFVKMGPIVEIRDRDEKVVEKYISRRLKEVETPFLIVMINEFSASASEILAGAIKDRGEGILVGEKSFGKGVVQSVFPLENDLYVKLTTAHYYTPSGISFHNKGIQPHSEVKDSSNPIRYLADDKIFQAAIKLAQANDSTNSQKK